MVSCNSNGLIHDCIWNCSDYYEEYYYTGNFKTFEQKKKVVWEGHGKVIFSIIFSLIIVKLLDIIKDKRKLRRTDR